MAMTKVQAILSDQALVPWLEERAFQYSIQRFVMASRVLVKSDLTGWVSRKVSVNERPLNPHLLEEGVEIPSTQFFRNRLTDISPEEWGDRYPISDRRIDTDPEPVIADVVKALGYSMGRKREQKLFAAAIAAGTLSGNIISVPTTAYAMDHAVQMQTVFEARAFDGLLYHVIHPYQEQAIKTELLKLSNAAVPEFRNEFIRQFSYGGFGGLNIAVSGMVPRKVKFRLVFGGTPVEDEVFRLRFGLTDTADIAIGADVAATIVNIAAALDDLDLGTFTVAGSAYTSITIQSPVFVDEESQLGMGRNASGVVVNGVTGGITIQEVSGVARAPFFQPQAVIYDVRKRLSMYQEYKPAFRTLDIGAHETYGVGAWNAERAAYIETLASSPLAVA